MLEQLPKQKDSRGKILGSLVKSTIVTTINVSMNREDGRTVGSGRVATIIE